MSVHVMIDVPVWWGHVAMLLRTIVCETKEHATYTYELLDDATELQVQ